MNICLLIFSISFIWLLVFSSAAQPPPQWSATIPVRLIGGKLSGVKLHDIISFSQLVDKAISMFNKLGNDRYSTNFTPLKRPVGFFFHLPDDPTMTRVKVANDNDLNYFVDIHQEQPLLLFRGNTPPDKPTPPSSPERQPAPRSLSSASSRESTPPEDKEMVYRRDLSRCCFTGRKLVRPTGGQPNLQILHLFPASKSYDHDGTELQRLPVGSRHDIRNLFLGAYEFNGWLDSGSVRVTPDYIIHIIDSEVKKIFPILDGKSLLLPNHSTRDSSTGEPVPCNSLSPQQIAVNLLKFPPSEMFAWHMDFIQQTILLPRQLAALKIQNACCPDCSKKAQCVTKRCSCYKLNIVCTSCISSKCKNLAVGAPIVPAPLSPDLDKDDDDE